MATLKTIKARCKNSNDHAACEVRGVERENKKRFNSARRKCGKRLKTALRSVRRAQARVKSNERVVHKILRGAAKGACKVPKFIVRSGARKPKALVIPDNIVQSINGLGAMGLFR